MISIPDTLGKLFSPNLRRTVARHRNAIGFALMAMVLLTMALDGLVGFGGGPHLLGLRFVYLLEVLVWLSYVTILSMHDGAAR